MLDFAAALEGLAADLATAGLSCSLDAADVNPPGVLLRASAILPPPPKLCGGAYLRAELLLVVPDTLTTAAYRLLSQLRDRVTTALPLTYATRAPGEDEAFERVVMPDDPTGLPALRIPVLILVETTTPEHAEEPEPAAEPRVERPNPR